MISLVRSLFLLYPIVVLPFSLCHSRYFSLDICHSFCHNSHLPPLITTSSSSPSSSHLFFFLWLTLLWCHAYQCCSCYLTSFLRYIGAALECTDLVQCGHLVFVHRFETVENVTQQSMVKTQVLCAFTPLFDTHWNLSWSTILKRDLFSMS